MVSTSPGFTVASSTPGRNLLTAIPAELWQAGVVIKIIPHARVRFVEFGNMVSRKAVNIKCCKSKNLQLVAAVVDNWLGIVISNIQSRR